MERLNERVQVIGAKILEQARQQSKELIDDATRTKERELRQFQEQLTTRMFRKMQEEATAVRLGAMREAASQRLEAHRALLRRREELSGLVVAAVRGRLADYVKTPEYREQVLEKLTALAEGYDHAESTVFFSADDMELAEQAKKILPGCSAEPSGEIVIGGFRLLNKKAAVLIDETLDRKLEEQRRWFLMHCNMRVV